MYCFFAVDDGGSPPPSPPVGVGREEGVDAIVTMIHGASIATIAMTKRCSSWQEMAAGRWKLSGTYGT